MVTLFLLVIYAAFISLGLPDSLLGVAFVAQKEFGASLRTVDYFYGDFCWKQ